MRQKRESVLSERWNDESLPLPVRVYRAKYQAISQVLDRNPEILEKEKGRRPIIEAKNGD